MLLLLSGTDCETYNSVLKEYHAPLFSDKTVLKRHTKCGLQSNDSIGTALPNDSASQCEAPEGRSPTHTQNICTHVHAHTDTHMTGHTYTRLSPSFPTNSCWHLTTSEFRKNESREGFGVAQPSGIASHSMPWGTGHSFQVWQ